MESLRDYQASAVAACLRQNTIVVLPTGSGKTLVAIHVMKELCASKAAVLVVSTRALVAQQAAYCRSQCDARVCELQGNASSDLHGTADIFVGVAAIVLQAFETKCLNATRVSVVVLDDCHEATGNSPQACLCRDVLHRPRGPRVVGLTAAAGASGVGDGDVDEARRSLETLLQATVLAPLVASRRRCLRVHYEREQVNSALLNKLFEPLRGLVKDARKARQRALDVLEELGEVGLRFHVEACLFPQLEAIAEREGPSARAAAEAAMRSWTSCGERKSPKLLALLDLLNPFSRGLIFVASKVLAQPLALALEQAGLTSTVLLGHADMTDTQRAAALQRGGLLVCTAGAEAGLDIPDCDLVVRFSAFNTAASHIHGAGRTRASGAKVFYFENDPEEEERRADRVEAAARPAAGLTPEEIHERRAALSRTAKGIHPLHGLSLFNSQGIVLRYCTVVMGHTVTYDDICTYVKPARVGQQRYELTCVRYPSPTGWCRVDRGACERHWRHVSVDDVLGDGRGKNMQTKEKERRWFFFFVAVELFREKLLDQSFEPTAEGLRSKAACKPLAESPASVQIKAVVRTGPAALPSAEAGTPSTAEEQQGNPISALLGEPSLISLASNPAQAEGDKAQGSGQACEGDHKSAVNTLASRLGLQVEYACAEVPGGGFAAVLSLPGLGVEFKGEPASKKKAAEQLAAAAGAAFLRAKAGRSFQGTAAPSKKHPQQPAAQTGAAGDAKASTKTAVPSKKQPQQPAAQAAVQAPQTGAAGDAKATKETGAPSTKHLQQPAAQAGAAGDAKATMATLAPSKKQPQQPAAQAPQTGAAGDAKATKDTRAVDATDWKSALNTLAARRWKDSAAVRYSVHGEGPFTATAHLPDERCFHGAAAPQKRQAEQLAAQVAVEALDATADRNWKSALSALVAKRWKSNAAVPYSVIGEGPFAATAHLPDGRCFHGAAAAQKKQAEQFAAQAAVEALERDAAENEARPDADGLRDAGPDGAALQSGAGLLPLGELPDSWEELADPPARGRSEDGPETADGTGEAADGAEAAADCIAEAANGLDEAATGMGAAVADGADAAADCIAEAATGLDDAAEGMDQAASGADAVATGADETTSVDEAADGVDETTNSVDEAAIGTDEAAAGVDEAAGDVDEAASASSSSEEALLLSWYRGKKLGRQSTASALASERSLAPLRGDEHQE